MLGSVECAILASPKKTSSSQANPEVNISLVAKGLSKMQSGDEAEADNDDAVDSDE